MTTVFQKLSVSAVLACATIAQGEWKQLAPLPDKLGVAAPFAGVSGRTLLVAGGANFPDKAPWEGGKKVWHDAVYAIDDLAGAWKKVGVLPRGLAYGVSATCGNRMVCVGGSDAQHCYPDAYWLDWQGGKLQTAPLPPLPVAISNACGACVDGQLYIAGGQTSNEATEAAASVFAIDLKTPRAAWRSIAPIPGKGRILATAAAFDRSFYVFGGAALSEGSDHTAQREYLSDAWQYTPGAGWKRVKNLPNPIVAAPSPAPTDDTGIFILGGDDGSHVGFKPVSLHPGFSKTILHFDPRAGTWNRSGEMPAARVTVPCVKWDGGWAVTSGEMRPGVRSPQVWMFDPKESHP
jgi:N-acetylneuraminate epimerase